MLTSITEVDPYVGEILGTEMVISRQASFSDKDLLEYICHVNMSYVVSWTE